ncbi:MAG: hypothetical protein ACREJC_15695 [Tepidisphaeraceae bacterium]
MTHADDNRAERIIDRAVLLERVWSGVSMALGLVAAGPLTFVLLSGRTRFAFGHILYYGACFVVFLAPAMLYLTLSIFLARRRLWAAVAGIVVAAFHGICAIAGLTTLILVVPNIGGPVLLAPIGGGILFTLAGMQLVYYLAQATRVITDAPQRGFEPIISRQPEA